MDLFPRKMLCRAISLKFSWPLLRIRVTSEASESVGTQYESKGACGRLYEHRLQVIHYHPYSATASPFTKLAFEMTTIEYLLSTKANKSGA
jgi:hypothetical protein